MSRWIDADKLHEAMQWAIEHDMYDKPFDYIAEVLDAPSIDIVRCKDCKWFDTDNTGEPYCMFSKGLGEASADDYCSYGERKDNE